MADESTPDAIMEGGIEEARKSCAQGQYEAALRTLMKTITLCPCSPSSKKHGSSKSCNILQCTNAVRSLDPDALYNVALGPCSCGAVWPSCTKARHLQAADELAYCLERASKFAAAFSAALSVIRLDPSAAIGYCRVVALIRRLTKDHLELETDAGRSLAALLRDAKLNNQSDLRSLLKPFLKCALHNTENYRHRPDDKYNFILRKMAHSMGMVEALRDPIHSLPGELVSMIFSYLDRISIFNCMNVCKSWSKVIELDPTIWHRCVLGRPRNPTRYLEGFLKKRRAMRSIIIQDASQFSLTILKVKAFLVYLPNLTRLHIGYVNAQPMQLFQGPLEKPVAQLTHLSLHGFREGATQLIQNLGAMFKTSLQSLDLIGRWSLDLPMSLQPGGWPQLKELRIGRTEERQDNVPLLRIGSLAAATPHLERLFLDGYSMHSDQPGVFIPGAMGSPWTNLRWVTFGPLMHYRRLIDPSQRFRCLPLRLRKLETIEFLSDDPYIVHGCLLVINPTDHETLHPVQNEDFPVEQINYCSLRVFRCRSVVQPEYLDPILEPPARLGTLEVLDLCIGSAFRRGHSMFSPGHHPDIQPIPTSSYTFALAKSLRVIGLSDFNWAPATHYTAFDGKPLLDWLKQLPDVDTVAVYPGPYRDSGSLIFELIPLKQLKIIYQDQLTGAHWDAGMELAKKHDVKLIHHPGRLCEVYPGYKTW